MAMMENNRVLFMVPTNEKNIYTPMKGEFEIKNIFFFAYIRTRPYPQNLVIKAVRDGQEEDVNLIFMPDHFYRAEVKGIGNFYFSSENPRNAEMIDEDAQHVKLSFLTPVNEDLFESACREHRFFFVG